MGDTGGTTMIRETERQVLSGFWALGLGGPVLVLSVYVAIRAGIAGNGWLAFWSILIAVLDLVLLSGLFVVNPNEGRVLQLFGSYVGTVRQPGLRWANPFYTKKRLSLRVRNFESGRLKVNDTEGNPIEIASVVVWKVVDGACGMVEMALERLARNKVIDLDGERKAAMVTNLLVVLCGERAAQPVLNTGTLYQ
jgi:hypothetical protein